MAEQNQELEWLLLEVLADFGREGMSVVAGLEAGHTRLQMVVPLGCPIRIGPEERSIESLEAAVTADDSRSA